MVINLNNWKCYLKKRKKRDNFENTSKLSSRKVTPIYVVRATVLLTLDTIVLLTLCQRDWWKVDSHCFRSNLYLITSDINILKYINWAFVFLLWIALAHLNVCMSVISLLFYKTSVFIEDTNLLSYMQQIFFPMYCSNNF